MWSFNKLLVVKLTDSSTRKEYNKIDLGLILIGLIRSFDCRIRF